MKGNNFNQLIGGRDCLAKGGQCKSLLSGCDRANGSLQLLQILPLATLNTQPQTNSHFRRFHQELLLEFKDFRSIILDFFRSLAKLRETWKVIILCLWVSATLPHITVYSTYPFCKYFKQPLTEFHQ